MILHNDHASNLESTKVFDVTYHREFTGGSNDLCKHGLSVILMTLLWSDFDVCGWFKMSKFRTMTPVLN